MDARKHPAIEKLAAQLQQLHLQLATAESCTGGMLGALCTSLPGSSEWYERGFITYTNTAKTELLDVPETLLAQYGAVSEPVAFAMAKGALQHSHADIAIAITGIAGPAGAQKDKPVGMVCFGLAVKNGHTTTQTHYFEHTLPDPQLLRNSIRETACDAAIAYLLAYLESCT